MLSPEIIKQIKRIELRAAHLVTSALTGNYLSAFKGRGMEFDEVREYVPGDDVRTIDWNVTARMNVPFIKILREERELTIMLMVDVSDSQAFGSKGRRKREQAAELAAVLAFLAIRNNDKVGLIVFADEVEEYIAPKKGRGHVWRIIRTVLTHEQRKKRGTDMAGALDFMTNVAARRSLCFLISDFWTTGIERSLTYTSRRHDLVCVQVRDPLEMSLPAAGIALLEDAESGALIELDTSDPQVQAAYGEQINKVDSDLVTLTKRLGLDLFKLNTQGPVTGPLLDFLRRRERRVGRVGA
jgi:uncharacterized protein (DUF58 family)